MKLLIKTLFLSSVLALAACSVSTGCDDYHTYRYVKAQTPVNVPADLDQPVNESVAPKTETTDNDKIDRKATGECLEIPPKL